jgi:predicted lipoprotein
MTRDLQRSTLFQDATSPAREPGADAAKDASAAYHADRFVQDSLRVKITPFMLDTFAGEWEELRRAQSAHTTEMEALRAANRSLTAQVYVCFPWRGDKSVHRLIRVSRCPL